MKPHLNKLHFRTKAAKQTFAVWPELLPPASLCKAGEARPYEPPALSGVDIRITKKCQKQPETASSSPER